MSEGKPTLREDGMREISGTQIVRQVVSDFSSELMLMLVANGRGDAWREERRTWLLMRLRQEVEELAEAICHSGSADVKHECKDVAAFAMMIWDWTTEQEESS